MTAETPNAPKPTKDRKRKKADGGGGIGGGEEKTKKTTTQKTLGDDPEDSTIRPRSTTLPTLPTIAEKEVDEDADAGGQVEREAVKTEKVENGGRETETENEEDAAEEGSEKNTLVNELMQILNKSEQKGASEDFVQNLLDIQKKSVVDVF